MTKTEYLAKIINKFNECFEDEIMCTRYEWGNNLPYGITKPLFHERHKEFVSFVRNDLGLCFGVVHHEHGIGNNNETYIFKKDIDDEGFEIEKKVCNFEYNYGIYCNLVVAYLCNTDGHVIIKKGRI